MLSISNIVYMSVNRAPAPDLLGQYINGKKIPMQFKMLDLQCDGRAQL